MVSPKPLPPTPPNASAMRIPENTEKGHDDPEPADEGEIQMEYSYGQLYSPSIGVVTINYLQQLRSG